MKRRSAFAVTILAMLLAFGAAAPVQAAPATGASGLRVAQSEMSLDAAVEMVRRRYEGKVVSATTRRNGDRVVHHIRVLSPDGKVRNVRVDARSGSIS